MPQSEFYSQNLGRSFPFVNNTHDQVSPLLVDARVTIRPEVTYTHGQHQVRLHSYGNLTPYQAGKLGVANGPFVALHAATAETGQWVMVAAFGTSAARFSEHPLQLFDRTQFEAVLGGANVVVREQVSSAITGWVALGDHLATAGHTLITAGDIHLEPTCVFLTPETDAGLGRTFVYNQRLTRHTAPPGCEHMSPVVVAYDQYQLACGPLEGSIDIIGGTNVYSSQNDNLNLITLLADGTAGEGGKQCDPIALAPGLYDEDEALRCGDVLRQINGIGGPDITLSAFTGVSVRPHPELNRIVIDIGKRDLKNCTIAGDAEQVEHLPTDLDGRNCGDNDQPSPVPGLPDEGAGYTVSVSTVNEEAADANIGGCYWTANGTGWLLSQYPCQTPYSCSRPERSPQSPDEILQTPCLPYIDPDADTIRNGDFLADIPLAAWNSDGDIAVVNSYASLPTSHFPLARFRSQAAQPVTLWQQNIPMVAGFYLLQATVYLPSGRFFFQITDRLSNSILYSYEHVTGSPTLVPLMLGPFKIDQPLINFSVQYHGAAKQDALAGLFSLTKQ